eukprot:gene36300-44037_t
MSPARFRAKLRHPSQEIARNSLSLTCATSTEQENYYKDHGETVDIYGDRTDITDPELLESMRQAKIRYNDGWQSSLLYEQHAGVWSGMYEILVPSLQGGEVMVTKVDFGKVRTSIEVANKSDLGYTFSWSEAYDSLSSRVLLPASLRSETRHSIVPSDMRTLRGNQCVGSAFTLGSDSALADENYVAELGVRDGDYRVRVRFVYEDLALSGITIIREQPGSDANVPYDRSSVGLGIYDPQVDAEQEQQYVTLQLGGALSLLFPPSLPAHPKAVLTIEHAGQAMRYQVDRIFPSPPTEKIQTLELTEVRTEDSSKYTAPFLPRPEFLQ